MIRLYSDSPIYMEWEVRVLYFRMTYFEKIQPIRGQDSYGKYGRGGDGLTVQELAPGQSIRPGQYEQARLANTGLPFFLNLSKLFVSNS